MIFKWLAERRRRKEEKRRQELLAEPVYGMTVHDRPDVIEARRQQTVALRRAMENSGPSTDGAFLDFKRRYPSPFEDDNERD